MSDQQKDVIPRSAITALWTKHADLVARMPEILDGMFKDAKDEDPKVRLPARKELMEYVRAFMEQYQYHLDQGTVDRLLDQYDPRTVQTLKLVLDRIKREGGTIDVDVLIKEAGQS